MTQPNRPEPASHIISEKWYYWATIWPDAEARDLALGVARDRILLFQEPYIRFVAWSAQARPSIQNKVETLYRACQLFATVEIEKLTSEIDFDFTMLATPKEPSS